MTKILRSTGNVGSSMQAFLGTGNLPSRVTMGLLQDTGETLLIFIKSSTLLKFPCLKYSRSYYQIF